LKTADELRKDHLTVPQLQIQIEAMTQMAAIRDFQLERYKQALDAEAHALDAAKRGYEQAVRVALIEEENARSLQRKLDAWYREPSLWAAVGAAAVGVLVVVLR